MNENLEGLSLAVIVLVFERSIEKSRKRRGRGRLVQVQGDCDGWGEGGGGGRWEVKDERLGERGPEVEECRVSSVVEICRGSVETRRMDQGGP